MRLARLRRHSIVYLKSSAAPESKAIRTTVLIICFTPTGTPPVRNGVGNVGSDNHVMSAARATKIVAVDLAVTASKSALGTNICVCTIHTKPHINAKYQVLVSHLIPPIRT